MTLSQADKFENALFALECGLQNNNVCLVMILTIYIYVNNGLCQGLVLTKISQFRFTSL